MNSFFTKRLLEERIEGFQFEVCFLGLDLEAIDRCRHEKRTERLSLTVLWQHRWRTDKNLRGALDIIEALAAKYRDVTFLVGRYEDWDEPFWVPRSLEDYSPGPCRNSPVLGNVSSYLVCQTGRLLALASDVDIAFSCSYHETFGIAMLEAAYAGAACVAPTRKPIPRFTVEPW